MEDRINYQDEKKQLLYAGVSQAVLPSPVLCSHHTAFRTPGWVGIAGRV